MEVPNPKNLANFTQHPYYPRNADITGYEPNELGVIALLGAFSAAVVVLFAATYLIVKTINPKLQRNELNTVLWFTLCAAIHLFFEGHFVANFAGLSSKQTIIGQMWKEYAQSDSRYLTNNSFVLCMETITVAIWGPLSLLTAASVVARHPMRYPLQLVVSIGHFYGDTLYYATSFFDLYMTGVSHSRPEAFYFWFYFIGTNSFWLFVPGYLVYQSVAEISKAIRVAERSTSAKKMH